MNVELFEAVETLKNFKAKARVISRSATDTDTVFATYRAIHKLFPYVKELSDPEVIKRNILIYAGAFTHFLEFLDEVVVSVSTQKPLPISSLIRMELSIDAVKEFRRVKERAISSAAGVQTLEYERTVINNSMGRGGQSVDRYYDGNSIWAVSQAEFIADWTNVPNHLDDMVNFTLAALAYHPNIGNAVYSDGDRRHMID